MMPEDVADGSPKGLNYLKPSFRNRLEDRCSPTQLGFQEINASSTVFVLFWMMPEDVPATA
jgi:hypothetical protein